MPSRTSRRTYLLALLIVAAIASFIAYEIHKENSENAAFLAHLTNLTQDSVELEKITSFESIENEGSGWLNINGYDSNPATDTYYTVRQVHFADFASATELTRQQVYTLAGIFQKYPFIGRVQNDVNISGECADEANASSRCTALEFHLKLSLLMLWFADPTTWYSSGYMYVPFELSKYNQAYLSRYFASVQQIAPHWYTFSGEHF